MMNFKPGLNNIWKENLTSVRNLQMQLLHLKNVKPLIRDPVRIKQNIKPTGIVSESKPKCGLKFLPWISASCLSSDLLFRDNKPI